MRKKLVRIATFGHRFIPLVEGSAGGDKVAEEIFTRCTKKGYYVTAYNRVYIGNVPKTRFYKGIKLIHFKTFKKKGFDTLYHSLKSTYHIIKYDTADIVVISNGGNSLWAIFLRIFRKKVIVIQDGIDWKRTKWPWYAKLYLFLSSYITAMIPNKTCFDNIFVKKYFEKKFNKKYYYIPYGVELSNSKQL